MPIKMILFDLDGTLLPMDQDVFVKQYFGLLAKKLAPHGYDAKKLVDSIWAGTAAMVRNNGECTNEQAFWNCFAQLMGEHTRKDEPIFDDYYRNEFNSVQQVCGFNPMAAETVKRAKQLGFRVALATNPLFPAIATENRMRWAGLDADDFELYTTYENAHFCKPNLEYYKEILAKLNVPAEECLMVGNDVGEDMITEKLGMKVFLLTDCLINKSGADISAWPHGGFAELTAYIEGLERA